MDKSYSDPDDLYAMTPLKDPPKRRRDTWLYILLLLGGFFVFESLIPVMRLRSNPPSRFVGVRSNLNKAQAREQQRRARACWDYARQSLQYRYPYGRTLPTNPPPALGNSNGNASEISGSCWPKLRQAWTHSDSWVEKYEWSTDWLTDPHGDVQEALHYVKVFFGIGH
ncbi:MAG: hypothetical protein P8Z30_02735 [Acidobacteriota bacterium]